MTQENDPKDKIFETRERAQLAAAYNPLAISDVSALPPEKVQQLIHELQVHQIELEMQNDGLRRAQQELEASRDNFSELYDFAPVGYVTLDEKGLILEANLTAAGLLGLERQSLIKMSFFRFVRQEFGDAFYLYLRQVFGTRSKQTCEIEMKRDEGSRFDARLEAVAVEDQSGQFNQCRTIVSDITEGKKAEEACRESEERFSKSFEYNPAFLTIIHMGTDKIVEVNDAWTRAIGYTREEAIGHTTVELGLYDDATYRKIMEEVKAKGSVRNAEVTVRSRTGESRVLLVSRVVIPVQDELHLLVMGLDVTEDRKTEEELRERESYLRAILNNAPFLMWLKDREGRFLAVNDVFAQSCGKESSEAVVGKTDLDVWPLDLAEGYRADDTEVMDLKLQKHVEEPICDRGITRWFETFKTPILDEDGNVSGTTGFARDITERKQAEQALTAHRNRLRTIIETEPECLKILDLHGRLAEMNPAGLAMLEVGSLEEAQEIPLTDYIVPEYQAAFRQLAQRVLQGESGILEFEIRGKRGTRRWLETNAAPLRDEHDQVTALLGITRDITERKKVEEALQRAHAELESRVQERTIQLREANRLLEEKIKTIEVLYEHIVQSREAKIIADHTAIVAHELRQPLAIIGGFARRLSRKTAGWNQDDSADYRESFQIIMKEVERLEGILGELIDYSKPQVVSVRRVNPNDIIEYVLRANREAIEAKNLSVDLDLCGNVAEIPVDPTRFEGLIRNLVTNAIEASEVDGVLRVATALSAPSDIARSIGHLRSESYFQVKVRNTGTSISREVIERIFNPYFTTKANGIGLGLTLSKKIVEDHGGALSVQSDDAGTLFTVWLPIFQPPV
jgi:PAS domain S-box-containing protein